MAARVPISAADVARLLEVRRAAGQVARRAAVTCPHPPPLRALS